MMFSSVKKKKKSSFQPALGLGSGFCGVRRDRI